jgi:hypothetical protein
MQFNRFFPAADGKLRLHRKWFVKRGKDWSPLEERILSIPAKAVKKDAGTLQVPLTGERIRWDEAGHRSTERFDRTLTYTKGEQNQYHGPWDIPLPAWLMGNLEPQFFGDRLGAVKFVAYVGYDLAGFHPYMAEIHDPEPPK